jgi:hypothetical protein
MKRGSKSSATFAANSLPYDNIKPKKPFIDPFPDSLVVKIKLKNGGTIINIEKFIESHFATVQTYNGNKVFLPYYKRLLELKEKLIN